MLLAGSIFKIWYDCRFKREIHGTPVRSRNVY